MPDPINLSKTLHFTGPLIRASAKLKYKEAANSTNNETRSYRQKVSLNKYLNEGEAGADPQRWRDCAWMLDMMDDMANFALKERLELTSEALRYAQQICRADILYQTQDKPG